MGRRIRYEAVPAGTAQAAGGREAGALPDLPPDGPWARIVKVVPAEVLSFYVAISNFIAVGAKNALVAANTAEVLQLIAFAVGLVGTFFVVRKVATEPPEGKPEVKQIAFTIAAFAIWSLAVSAPFALVGLDETQSKFVGGLLVIVFVFVSGWA